MKNCSLYYVTSKKVHKSSKANHLSEKLTCYATNLWYSLPNAAT